MRVYAHIVALLLAVSLIAKPCAAIFYTGAPGAASIHASAAKTETQHSACTSKCLKARIEEQAQLLAKPSHDASKAPDLHAAAAITFAWPADSFARQQAGPGSKFTRSSRQLLCELCRQLT
jgi:hypothetical protein